MKGMETCLWTWITALMFGWTLRLNSCFRKKVKLLRYNTKKPESNQWLHYNFESLLWKLFIRKDSAVFPLLMFDDATCQVVSMFECNFFYRNSRKGRFMYGSSSISVPHIAFHVKFNNISIPSHRPHCNIKTFLMSTKCNSA